jgi:sulfur carrier protein
MSAVSGNAAEPGGPTARGGGGMAMCCTVNGEATQLAPATTVEDVLTGLLGPVAERRRGVAVAVNAEVVPRSAWAETELCEGDSVEVLTVAQGG